MKKLLLLIICTISCAFLPYETFAKEIKISATPSDAKIYIDGSYAGDGVVTASIRRKDGFIVVKLEKIGYIPLETKIFFTEKRKAVSYTMRKDSFFDVSVATGLVNKYFTVKVSKDLYSVDGQGKRNAELAWKMIHQVILNYFDEIQTTDLASGFIQTPWMYKLFPQADKQMRTRVTIKESNLGGGLTFQIKISSELAYIRASHYDENFQEVSRIVKELEPLISEFQSRLGK